MCDLRIEQIPYDSILEAENSIKECALSSQSAKSISNLANCLFHLIMCIILIWYGIKSNGYQYENTLRCESEKMASIRLPVLRQAIEKNQRFSITGGKSKLAHKSMDRNGTENKRMHRNLSQNVISTSLKKGVIFFVNSDFANKRS